MNIEAVKNEIISQAGPGLLLTDSDLLEAYTHDETSDLTGTPDLVVIARTVEDVRIVLQACNRHRVPVIPRGAGTGVTGGAIAVTGGVVLSLEKLNRIIEIDVENMIAVVEPGVITGDLQRAALEHGLMYPPDPASLDSCSLGGNIAECAGGPRAVKYGTTKDYVTGLEFVLADGSVITHGGKFIKNATGYNLTGILLGSEGTLAVITRLYLKLVPVPPHSLDLLIPFKTLEEAVDGVHAMLIHRVSPAALEFMEEDALTLVAEYLGDAMPHPEAGAHLLVQLDGNSEEAIGSMLEKIQSILPVNPESIMVAESLQQKERLWTARRSIREAIHAKSPVFLAEDSVVPRSKIPVFLREVKSSLNQLGLRSVIFGHAGDGNVHIDVLREDMEHDKWQELQPRLKDIIYGAAYRHGGTITGEHGTGYTRKQYLQKFASPGEIELLRRIKGAFDPNGIINPGKVIDL